MSVCFRLSFLAIAISLLIISSFVPSQQATSPDIATYWGQNTHEGSLAAKCSSNYYKYVIIGYLTNFSQGHTPALNLSGHCDPARPATCIYLGEEIKNCQNQGVKVFLSLGFAQLGPAVVSPIPSTVYARWLAFYIWDHYLGGQSSYRPFGDAELDGVDFESRPPGIGLKWIELALFFKYISYVEGKKIYLSASPQCPEDDYHLDAVINAGLVDYAWVRFFNNPGCQYKPNNIHGLLASWSYWSSKMANTSKIGKNLLFMGLPSSESPDVASGGYIPPEVLMTDVLPKIRKSPNYGGIMVWTQFHEDDYSPIIKNSNIKLDSIE